MVKKQTLRISEKLKRDEDVFLSQQDVVNLLHPIKQVSKLSLSFCSKFCSFGTSREQEERNALQNKLNSRFTKALDIRNIVSDQRNFDLVIRRMLTRQQQMLLKYQRERVIKCMSDSSENGKTEQYAKFDNSKHAIDGFSHSMEGF